MSGTPFPGGDRPQDEPRRRRKILLATLALLTVAVLALGQRDEAPRLPAIADIDIYLPSTATIGQHLRQIAAAVGIVLMMMVISILLVFRVQLGLRTLRAGITLATTAGVAAGIYLATPPPPPPRVFGNIDCCYDMDIMDGPAGTVPAPAPVGTGAGV